MSRAAADRWHELLFAGETGEASHVMLEEELRRRHLVFGGRPLCTVLRPRLYSTERLRSLRRRTERLMRVFRRAHEAAMSDPAVLAQFRLLDWEVELVRSDPGYQSPSPHGRLDFFHVDETDALALTEYNAETPAGAGFNDLLAEAFAAIPVMREFRREFDVRPVPARSGVVSVLLDTWREFSGSWNRPRIAIVDWDDVPTTVEFEILQAHFRSLGIETEIADPRALAFRGGRLHAPGGEVDLVYKRVLIHELVEREGLDHPLVRAVRERAVCMANPFRCKVLHKKASLAFLSDERNAALFEPAEQALIAETIPWTRVVEARRTRHAGRDVDLLEFAEANRDRLVIKPNDDYGGAGVVLGWTVSAEAWREALRGALAAPSIVQERVVIPSEPYPSWESGGLRLIDRMYDTAPFVLHGSVVDGCLTRLSTAQLLNVTAGGGSTVPMFVAEPRN